MPPTAGVEIITDSELLSQHGLKIGDIIVAIDGVRVRTLAQYIYIHSSLQPPKLPIVIWDGENYRAIEAHLTDLRFGVTMQEFPKPEKD